MACGGLDALTRLNLKVPDEVAVVSFGGTDTTPTAPIERSTIDTHNEQTGRVAIQLLQQLVEDKQPEHHRVLIDPELIIRASSRG